MANKYQDIQKQLKALRTERSQLNRKIAVLVRRGREVKSRETRTKSHTSTRKLIAEMGGPKWVKEHYGGGQYIDNYSIAPADRCEAVMLYRHPLMAKACRLLGVEPNIYTTRCLNSGVKERNGHLFCKIHYKKSYTKTLADMEVTR